MEGHLATTRVTYGEDVDAQEQASVNAMGSAATFELSGGQLIIRDGARQEVLGYSRIRCKPIDRPSL